MIRSICVICSGSLQYLFKRIGIPISFSPPAINSPYSTDIYSDQEFLCCKQCGCVQLKNLIDPIILYADSHNITYDTPTWKEHHTQLCTFITDRIDYESVIEIGGMSGALSLRILTVMPKIQYTCIDLCKGVDNMNGIVFKQGNCENYDFKGTECIIMSHVFEHLYHPATFISNVAKYNVPSIFISIPNMDALVNSNIIHILHNEHTFYINRSYIEWMFSQCGYILSSVQNFKTHSLFFHFIRIDHTPLPLYNNESISNFFLQMHDKIQLISNLSIKPHSFIAPGGHFGQLIYTLCKPDNILGFLDNDISKQGHRIYGTPFYTFPFDILNTYTGEQINVYVYAGPYTPELIEQLQKYNVNIVHI